MSLQTLHYGILVEYQHVEGLTLVKNLPWKGSCEANTSNYSEQLVILYLHVLYYIILFIIYYKYTIHIVKSFIFIFVYIYSFFFFSSIISCTAYKEWFSTHFPMRYTCTSMHVTHKQSWEQTSTKTENWVKQSHTRTQLNHTTAQKRWHLLKWSVRFRSLHFVNPSKK